MSPFSNKYPAASLAGQFVEVTDVRGERIVAMFTKSNHFICDSTDPLKLTTPHVLTEGDSPVILGTLSGYVSKNNLATALLNVDAFMKKQLPERAKDSLFFCRVLHRLHRNDLHVNPSEQIIADMIAEILQEEQAVYDIHEFIIKVEQLATGQIRQLKTTRNKQSDAPSSEK